MAFARMISNIFEYTAELKSESIIYNFQLFHHQYFLGYIVCCRLVLI